jgi:hypothetical protein
MPSVSDIDIYLYNSSGYMVGWSESANNDVEDTAYKPLFGGTHGGPGFEEIRHVAASSCAGFVLDSESSQTLGEKVRLKIWLTR